MVAGAAAMTLAEVMDQHPQLSTFGIGVFAPEGKTVEERRAELAQNRRELLDREQQVMMVAAWLIDHVTPIKTPSVGSYGMKHVTEKAREEYLTNGELIAAALIAGYSIQYTAGPNPLLGMSKRDVDRLRKQGNASP